MATRKDLISDLEMRLYGGNPSDDSVVRSQIGAVLDTVAATVMAEWIRVRNGGIVPASITTPYTSVIKKREDECFKAQYYAEYPKDSEGNTLPLLGLPMDEGLVEVEVGKQRVISSVSYPLLRNSQELRFGKKMVYALRTSNEIQLYGGMFLEGAPVRLWGVFIDTDPESDKKYPLLDELQSSALNAAEEILRRELGTKQDLVDDGI